jgi:hypothetical protein
MQLLALRRHSGIYVALGIKHEGKIREHDENKP